MPCSAADDDGATDNPDRQSWESQELVTRDGLDWREGLEGARVEAAAACPSTADLLVKFEWFTGNWGCRLYEMP